MQIRVKQDDTCGLCSAKIEKGDIVSLRKDDTVWCLPCTVSLGYSHEQDAKVGKG